jgi:predicted nucleotidyltransferase
MTDAIDRAVEVLAKEMRPRKIILFGSTARGKAGPDSDIDLLVVIERFDSRSAEMNRASALLAPLRIDADVLVYAQLEFEQWGEVVNHVINEALLDGRVVYDAA